MKNPWEINRHPSSSEITGAAVADTVAFPQLSSEKKSKRQLKYAYLEVAPPTYSEVATMRDRNLSSAPSSLSTIKKTATTQEHNFKSASGGSSSSVVTQEHTFESASGDSSSLSVAETGGTQEHNNNVLTPSTGDIKKDWSAADDAKTCRDLLRTKAQTGFVDRQGRVLSRSQKRLQCFTKFCVDDGGQLPTVLDPKPSITTTGHGSSSSSEQSRQSQHKHQDEEITGADNAGLEDQQEIAGADNAGVEDAVAFPILTGERQSKKQTRNAHLAPRP